jgi:hypothetical protein
MANGKELLEAIKAADIKTMDQLYESGVGLNDLYATHDLSVQELQKVLFTMVGNYQVVEWLCLHGLVSGHYYKKWKTTGIWTEKCRSPYGENWGLIPRALYFGAYDVIELLAKFGFDDFDWKDKYGDHYLYDWIFQKNDVRLLKILRQHGDEPYGEPYYGRLDYDDLRDSLDNRYCKWRRLYPRSKATEYFNSVPVEKRKSVGLDCHKFYKIEEPHLRGPRLRFRKLVRTENEIAMQDYKDRIRAQAEYIQWLTSIGLEPCSEAELKKDSDDFFASIEAIGGVDALFN